MYPGFPCLLVLEEHSMLPLEYIHLINKTCSKAAPGQILQDLLGGDVTQKKQRAKADFRIFSSRVVGFSIVSQN